MTRKSNVVKLRPRGALTDVQKRSANSAISTEDRDELRKLEDIKGKLWVIVGKKTYKEFAAESGLSAQTVRNFATGETKRPAFFTVRRMAQAVGMDLELFRDNTKKK